jgi:hypothetical protein
VTARESERFPSARTTDRNKEAQLPTRASGVREFTSTRRASRLYLGLIALPLATRQELLPRRPFGASFRPPPFLARSPFGQYRPVVRMVLVPAMISNLRPGGAQSLSAVDTLCLEIVQHKRTFEVERVGIWPCGPLVWSSVATRSFRASSPRGLGS